MAYFTDSRIRFKLEGISYHDVGAITEFAPNQGTASNLFNTQYGVEQPYMVNVYFYTNLDPDEGSGGAYGASNVTSQNSYEPFINMQNYGLGGSYDLLVHEFGHAAGIAQHTWTSFCDDDNYTDTFDPDANQLYVPCSPTTPWSRYDGENNLLCSGVGVSNNIMGYNSCRNYLSPQQIRSLHKLALRQIGLGQGLSTTPRRALECEPSPLATVTHIVASTEWRVPKALNKNLEVHDGATLTIKCKVSFGTEAKLIIHPGGKVIVEGGWLTSLDGHCHTFWPGVSVWGNNTENQFPENNPTHQASSSSTMPSWRTPVRR